MDKEQFSDFNVQEKCKQTKSNIKTLSNSSNQTVVEDEAFHYVRAQGKPQPSPRNKSFTAELLSVTKNTSFADITHVSTVAYLRKWSRRILNKGIQLYNYSTTTTMANCSHTCGRNFTSVVKLRKQKLQEAELSTAANIVQDYFSLIRMDFSKVKIVLGI